MFGIVYLLLGLFCLIYFIGNANSMKINEWIDNNKKLLIIILILVVLFFIFIAGVIIGGGDNKISNILNKKEYKKYIDSLNKEQKVLTKQYQITSDSLEFYKELAEENEIKANQHEKEIIYIKIKGNREVASIPYLSRDSIVSLHSAESEEYIRQYSNN